MPIVEFGAPVFWPWVPDMGPYHNRAVWPFVQSYWVLASAKAGNEQGVLHGISSVWRAAMMYATNKENFVANLINVQHSALFVFNSLPVNFYMKCG